MSMTKTDKLALKPAGKFMFEELGQRWHHIKHGEGQITEPRLEVVKLYAESDVLALLDELEAADRRNAELNSTLERWATDRAQSASELDDAEKRIAELEQSHAQVIHARDHYKRVASEGIQSLVEGRTLTVKLPAGTEVNGFRMLIESEVVARLREQRIAAEVFSPAGIALDTWE